MFRFCRATFRDDNKLFLPNVFYYVGLLSMTMPVYYACTFHKYRWKVSVIDPTNCSLITVAKAVTRSGV